MQMSLNSGVAGNFSNNEAAASVSPVKFQDSAIQTVTASHKCC